MPIVLRSVEQLINKLPCLGLEVMRWFVGMMVWGGEGVLVWTCAVRIGIAVWQ